MGEPVHCSGRTSHPPASDLQASKMAHEPCYSAVGASFITAEPRTVPRDCHAHQRQGQTGPRRNGRAESSGTLPTKPPPRRHTPRPAPAVFHSGASRTRPGRKIPRRRAAMGPARRLDEGQRRKRPRPLPPLSTRPRRPRRRFAFPALDIAEMGRRGQHSPKTACESVHGSARTSFCIGQKPANRPS